MVTRTYYREINPTAAMAPLVFMVVTHSALGAPIRIVNDNQDWVSGGNTYTAFPFEVIPPNQGGGQIPSATVRIDNTGRDLMGFLESAEGGRGAKVRFFVTARSTPDVIEQDFNHFDLLSTNTTNSAVEFKIGWESPLSRPASLRRFDPATAPGLFEG